MGIRPYSLSGCGYCGSGSATIRSNKFTILRVKEIGGRCVVEARYADAKNYEGRKIMLFDAPRKIVIASQYLDPHFCDGPHLWPFARFVPTEHGWQLAVNLLIVLAHKTESP